MSTDQVFSFSYSAIFHSRYNLAYVVSYSDFLYCQKVVLFSNYTFQTVLYVDYYRDHIAFSHSFVDSSRTLLYQVNFRRYWYSYSTLFRFTFF